MRIIRYLLTIIIIIIAILYFAFNPIAKQLISDYASKALKTSVNIGEIKNSFKNRSVSAYAIEIQNPVGFKNKNVLEINQFNIALSSDTTLDLIIIDDFSFKGITAIFEQKGVKINIKTLTDRLITTTNAQNNITSNNNTSLQKIIIKKLSVLSSKIIIDTKLLKEEIKLPNINLSNIGGTNGISIDLIGSHLIKIILDKTQEAAKKRIKELAKKKLKKTLVRKISEKLGIKADSLNEIKKIAKEKLSNSNTNNLKEELKDKIEDKFKNIFKF